MVGLNDGIIYAILALAIVLIYNSSRQLNFAQGELATLCLYGTWTVTTYVHSLWFGVVIGLIAACCFGYILHHVLIRRFANEPQLTNLILFIGILLLVNGLDGALYGYDIKSIESLFPNGSFELGIALPYSTLGNLLILVFITLALYGFFYHTRTGLAMRAVGSNRTAASLAAINVPAMVGVAWGLSLMVGLVAAFMVAPVAFLEPNMMFGFLIYGFVGALVGGIDNPWGAIIGGLIIGVADSMLGTYLVGGQLKMSALLVMMICILVLMPNGIFGSRHISRV